MFLSGESDSSQNGKILQGTFDGHSDLEVQSN